MKNQLTLTGRIGKAVLVAGLLFFLIMESFKFIQSISKQPDDQDYIEETSALDPEEVPAEPQPRIFKATSGETDYKYMILEGILADFNSGEILVRYCFYDVTVDTTGLTHYSRTDSCVLKQLKL